MQGYLSLENYIFLAAHRFLRAPARISEQIINVPREISLDIFAMDVVQCCMYDFTRRAWSNKTGLPGEIFKKCGCEFCIQKHGTNPELAISNTPAISKLLN